MTMGMYAESAGLINSPGFGALLALAGTVMGAGGSIWIANRTRGQQRSDQLREALSAVTRQRHSFTANQEHLYRAAFDNLEARAITLEEFYTARDPYYDQCIEILLAIDAVRLHTKDAATLAALDQLREICGPRPGDLFRYFPEDEDGRARRNELRTATIAAFSSLQAAAERLMAK